MSQIPGRAELEEMYILCAFWNFVKITVIVNLEAPKNVKQLRAMLGHTSYYRKFIKSHAQITAPIEKILKKDATICRDE